MNINVSQHNASARIELVGDINEQGAENLKQCFRRQDLSSLKEVVVDFSQVTLIGSAGIGKLLLFYKDLAMNRAPLALKNVPPAIYDLLLVLKLDSIFSISREA
jgi:anti-anti-sigma factor